MRGTRALRARIPGAKQWHHMLETKGGEEGVNEKKDMRNYVRMRRSELKDIKPLKGASLRRTSSVYLVFC